MSHPRKILLLIVIAAAIGCATQAIAQSSHGEQAAAKHNGRGIKAERAQAVAPYGTPRTPTHGDPNPNSPALTGGGSTGYNSNLYNY